jgi:DNA helicase HerA-like ATPase
MSFFNDPEGWEARLRQQSLITRSARTRGEEISVTSSLGVVDARFQLTLLDMLSDPVFLAIERQTSQGLTHMIYEAIAPKPTHFQELGMNTATPTIIRREMLQTIDQSWGKSDESWIDIIAVPTHHRMDIKDGNAEFRKTRLSALVGAKVHVLSREAVDQFLSIKEGTPIGDLLGFGLPLKINLENLVRYHSACLGFTGSGKSNFTSYLIRRALGEQPDLRVVVFDIAGEYFVHLADFFAKDGVVYSTEQFENFDQFMDSQVVPETLEERLGNSKAIAAIVRAVMEEGRLRNIEIARGSMLTLGFILDKLESVGDRAGAAQAAITLERLRSIMREEKLRSDSPLSTLRGGARDKVLSLINEAETRAPERSGLKGDLAAIRDYLTRTPETHAQKPITASELAKVVLDGEGGLVNVVYVPDPTDARLIVAQFIRSLLHLKKTAGKAKEKTLIVLDEAQEYIPDRTRSEDNTDISNIAVEELLRQGRKYRAHCWLGSQRVAHLNVSALQQVHSYFINVLPRIYDRITIADAFAVSYDLLDKTLDLETGQWMFVSYKAAKRKNVPVFIEAPDNETTLTEALSS